MSAARLVIIDLDRSYDLRVLGALPSTLNLFPKAALEAQLDAMSKQRRAICFTIMAPVRRFDSRHSRETAKHDIAVVLVCLHVAPELAARGLASLLNTLQRSTTPDAEPLHEIAAPLTRSNGTQTAGFYREAIYGDADAYVAITTHTPAEMPTEAMEAVAAATKGSPVDIVTTVAITLHRPQATIARHHRPMPRPTLH